MDYLQGALSLPQKHDIVLMQLLHNKFSLTCIKYAPNQNAVRNYIQMLENVLITPSSVTQIYIYIYVMSLQVSVN
jgi:hypothetical protein